MITARMGWLSGELTVGAEDTPLVLGAIDDANILKIDLEGVERVHVAHCEDEPDLTHFVLAMDRSEITQICCEGDFFAVLRDDKDGAIVWRARADLQRTCWGRGEMIDLRCYQLSIADQKTADALRAALAARAGQWTHGPGFTVWAPPPAQ